MVEAIGIGVGCCATSMTARRCPLAMVLSFFEPLWFKVVHKRMDA